MSVVVFQSLTSLSTNELNWWLGEHEQVDEPTDTFARCSAAIKGAS